MFDSFEQNPELPNPAPETPGPEMAESVEKSVPEDSALRLQDFVSKGLGHLEHNFIFRKLGITYDYASPPRDFPRSTLPNVKEVREGMPNAAGIGTGMTNCTANTSLLLDGYLTRLELGIARPEEDRIMDRLVAGLIRIGTAGPRNQFVRGLTPDGRGFYPATSMVDHIHYAHALYRACHSPTIRIESQTKIRDICAKWLERIVKSDFTITGLTPEESRLSPRLPGEDHVEKADEREWERLVTLLHLAAVTYNLQGGQEWKELYDRLSTGPEGPNLKPNLPEALTDSARLLALQIALSDICALDPAGPQAEVISVLRRKLAHRAARSLASYQNLLVKETSEIPALDWRSDLQPAEGDEDSLRSLVHSAWPEVKLEAETVRESTRAFLTIMLSGDDALIHDNLPAMEKLMRSVPWDQLILATSISPLPLAHALGQEKGFWDPRVECSLGEKSFGGIYGIEFNEGYELLPADGPRPEGWESKPAAFPKIVLDLENKEKQQNQPSPTSKTRSAKNDNGRGRKPATGSGNGNDSGEKVAQKNGDSEKSRQPGKRRSRGRRNRRRSSNNPNGRSQNKPNNSSNSNS